MRVTLKKASALALALTSIGVAIPHTLQVSAFDDAPDAFDSWKAELQAQLAKVEAKWSAVYAIRNLIGQANAGKINEILTERALLDKLIAIYSEIPIRKTQPSVAMLNRQFEAARGSALGPGAARGVNINIELETDSFVTPRLDELKAKKRVLEDSLAGWNHDTSITLPDDVVAILKDFKLV